MLLPIPPTTYHHKPVTFRTLWYVLPLALAPVILVGWVVLTYALNIPYWDDFMVQEHLLKMKQASGSLKVKYLFDQHWEHRIIWTRLVFVIFAKLNGSLNYYGLTLIGASGLLAILGILFAQFRRLAFPLLYFVPVPFLLITLQSYENLIWAMASIQNFWIIVFALGAFYSLAQNTQLTRWLALSLAILATFTSGNGPLVIIAGLFVLTYQRQWRFLGVWAVTMMLLLFGYFYTYQRISFFPSPFRYPFIDWVKAFFVFLGAFGDASPNSGSSLIDINSTVWLTIAIGALVVVMAGLFLISAFRLFTTKHIDEPSSFFLGCFLFLFATAAITVYSRVGFDGPAYLLQGRYKVNSALALSIVYLYSLYQWRKSAFLYRYVVIMLVLVIGQSLLSDYLCLEGIVNQHRRIVAEYFNYLTNTPLDRQRSIQTVFVPTEPPLFSDQVDQLAMQKWWSAPVTTTVDRVIEKPSMYHILKADAFNPTLSSPDNGSYIFFKSQTHTYLFAAQPLVSTTKALPGFAPYVKANGFYARVLKEKLVAGRYRIGLLTNQNNQIHLAMTNRYITFSPL